MFYKFMMIFQIMYILILFSVFGFVVSLREWWFAEDTSMTNRIRRSGVLSTSIVESGGRCSLLCDVESNCKSLYYNSLTSECVLLKKTLSFDDGSDVAEGWRYFIKLENGNEWTLFDEHNYYFNTNIRLSWVTAKGICEGMGAYLIEIDSQEEQDVVDSETDEKSWTGGNDRDIEGEWRWEHSKKLLDYDNWYNNQPDTTNPEKENCLEVGTSGEWNDVSCDAIRYFICERS